MAIRGFNESTLSQSEVFQGVNKSVNIQAKAVNLIKTAKHLTSEDIEAAYVGVSRITDSLTSAAVKAFNEEKTVLVYNDVPKLSMSQTIPFLTFKNGVTYVFVDKYITVSKDGVLRIQEPILRDLLVTAVVASGIKKNYDAFAGNQYLQKILMEIYTELFTRIINREFSIAADKPLFDTLKYWVNRFFLERVMGATDTPENLEKLATNHVKFLDEMAVADAKNKYDEAHITQATDLLNLIKTLSPRMKSLALGLFLNDWINYYYLPSMLALDNVEYLVFMCIVLLSGNNIINIGASSVVKEAKNIKSFRSELQKLI